jgi:hypothetical protein
VQYALKTLAYTMIVPAALLLRFVAGASNFLMARHTRNCHVIYLPAFLMIKTRPSRKSRSFSQLSIQPRMFADSV